MPSDLRQPPHTKRANNGCLLEATVCCGRDGIGVQHAADVDFEAICKASSLAIKASQSVTTLNCQFAHSHSLCVDRDLFIFAFAFGLQFCPSSTRV